MNDLENMKQCAARYVDNNNLAGQLTPSKRFTWSAWFEFKFGETLKDVLANQ